MKIIGCPKCGDRVVLMLWKKYCKCKWVYGKYTNNVKAIVSPNAVVYGLPTQLLFETEEGDLLVPVKLVWEHDGTDIIRKEF